MVFPQLSPSYSESYFPPEKAVHPAFLRTFIFFRFDYYFLDSAVRSLWAQAVFVLLGRGVVVGFFNWNLSPVSDAPLTADFRLGDTFLVMSTPSPLPPPSFPLAKGFRYPLTAPPVSSPRFPHLLMKNVTIYFLDILFPSSAVHGTFRLFMCPPSFNLLSSRPLIFFPPLF